MEEKKTSLSSYLLWKFFPPTFPLLFLNTFSASPSVSLMAFHHRKLLFQNHHNHGNVSPTPSPHESPVSQFPLPSTLPIPTPEINHVHILQIAVIVMGCMVGVTMFLCTVSVIVRGYYYSRRRNHNHSRSNSPILFDVNGDGDRDSSFSDNDEMERVIDHPIWFIRTEGLQQSVIDSITVFKYRKDEGLIEGTECSVCLGEFQQDESLRLLPKCDHAFHILCIDTWLRSHKNCPLCRAPVVNVNVNVNVNGDGGGADLRVTVTDQSDSSVSGETLNQEGQIEIFDDVAGSYHVEESESSVMRFVGDDDSGVSSSDILPNLLVEEIQLVKRSISMDSSSTVFHDLNSENDLNFGDKMNSSSKDMSVAIAAKNGSGSSTLCKVASIGLVLHKRPSSFSNNRKLLFSKHSRSQSSSLPL